MKKSRHKKFVLITLLFNSLNAKCIYTYTCENYLPHHLCSAGCYVVLIKITLNTIVDAWKYNT